MKAWHLTFIIPLANSADDKFVILITRAPTYQASSPHSFKKDTMPRRGRTSSLYATVPSLTTYPIKHNRQLNHKIR